MPRWREFIEDGKGIGSGTRLCMVFGVFIGGIINLGLAIAGKLTGDIFGVFMFASGGVYGVGKWQERISETAQIKADSPNQQPDPLPPTPATVINVSGQQKAPDAIAANNVAVQAKGDVTVRNTPKRKKR